MKKYASMLFFSLALTGCATQQAHYKEHCSNLVYSLFCSDEVHPVEMSLDSSHAYNLAKQTSLVQNEENVLRDFSAQEIEQAKLRLNHLTANNKMIYGASDRIGENAHGIATRVHKELAKLAFESKFASSPVFIVELNAADHADKIEAMKYLVSKIDSAAKTLLSDVGDVTVVGGNDGFDHSLLAVGGRSIPIGLKRPIEHKSAGSYIDSVDVSITGTKGLYYSYGVLNSPTGEDLLVAPPSPLALSALMSNVSYEGFYKAYTKALPEGFYIYTPPFPTFQYDGITYADFSEVVPAIYHQGKKYTFTVDK